MALDDAELQRQVARGAAAYTPLSLKLYDHWVYGVAVRVMRCPPQTFFAFYANNISNRHLDIGVGTGVLLKHCQKLRLLQQVTLLDLNQASLDATENTLRPMAVKKVRANMLEPFPPECLSQEGAGFLSVGLNFLLHCVPGSFCEKGIVFQHIKKVLAPDGLVFGSTALYQPGALNAPARFLFDRYNQIGVFHNKEDYLQDLQRLLRDLFENVELELKGSVVFFRASDSPLE